MSTKLCEVCLREFSRPPRMKTAEWEARKYCCRACFDARPLKRATASKRCPHCGVTFHRPEDMRKCRWEHKQYCTPQCAATARWVGRKQEASKRAQSRKSGHYLVSAETVAEQRARAEARPIITDGPRFSTADEWLAHYGVQKAREGLPQYAGTNDTGPIPVGTTARRGGRHA